MSKLSIKIFHCLFKSRCLSSDVFIEGSVLTNISVVFISSMQASGTLVEMRCIKSRQKRAWRWHIKRFLKGDDTLDLPADNTTFFHSLKTKQYSKMVLHVKSYYKEHLHELKCQQTFILQSYCLFFAICRLKLCSSIS